MGLGVPPHWPSPVGPYEQDRTAQTEPLTDGQKIVAWWESTTSASEPADLADKIDEALSEAFRRGQLSTLPD